ncbi:MAG: Hsp20/alpha crystallin family protein [Cyanobacteria bacterium J06639_1]
MAFPYWKTTLEIEMVKHFLENTFHGSEEASAKTRSPEERTLLHPTEILETDDRIFVSVEMPGLNARDIDLSVGENYVKIRYERLPRNRGTGGDFVYYRSEIRYGFISHMIPLPALVQPEPSEAEYVRGVLKLKLEKRQLPSASALPSESRSVVRGDRLSIPVRDEPTRIDPAAEPHPAAVA